MSKKRISGSYTVEAALLMPIFACVMAFALLFFGMLVSSWGINAAIRQSAFYMSVCGDCGEDNSPINKATVIGACDLLIVKNEVPMRFIFGSYVGLDHRYTEVTDKDIDILVRYKIPLRVGGGIWGIRFWDMVSRSKARRWVGYDPSEGAGDDDEYVYITQYGSVYHERIDCPYLAPSIHSTAGGFIGSLRNRSGGKYGKCERCGGTGSVLYYTDYGDCYHSSLTCSGLKRTIYCKKKSELGGKYPPCGKCGGG